MHPFLTFSEPRDVASAFDDAVRRIVARTPSAEIGAVAENWARLACGDFDRVRTLVRTAPATAALPLNVACYAAWTGDLPTVAAAWNTVRNAVDRLLGGDDGTPIHAATCRIVAATAADIGDHRLAGRLRAAARAGAANEAAEDAIYPLLPASADPDVRLVGAAVERLLGVRPDAVRGRLRLRPGPAPDTPEIAAAAIPFGDASISCHFRRQPRLATWTVTQETGAVPVTLLLEPLLETPPDQCEVDAHPADLAPQRRAAHWLVPVQLVLDRPRTLRLRWTRKKEPPRGSGS